MAFNVHCGDSIAAISLHSELLSLTEEPDGCCEKTAVVEKKILAVKIKSGAF